MGIIKITFKKINGILSKEQTEILETAILSMIPVVLTKILGFLFGLVAATKFGNFNQDWQNFLLANAIPDFLTNVIIAGTIGSIVIPSLVSSKKNDDNTTFLRLFSTILNVCMIVLSIISILLIIFGDFLIPFLLNILAPNSLSNIDSIQGVIDKTKILLVPQLILGISTFISSGLNVYNRFLVPHFAPLFFNFGRLFGLVFLVSFFGIYGVVYGIYIGAVLHLLLQIPQARSVGLKYFFVIDFSNKYLKEIFFVALPRFFTLAIENFVRLITNFLSFSIKGGISALYFADQVASFVPSVFAFTFAMASYPKLSLTYENKDFEKFRSIVIKTLNEILFLIIPFVVTILILRVPIARLVFGSLPNTALSIVETYSIAWNLLFFGIGLVFLSGKWFMYRAFYATKDTKTPLITSIVSGIFSLLFIVLFLNLFSHSRDFAISETKLTLENFFVRGDSLVAIGGIPFGLSLGYLIEFCLLLYLFSKKRVSLQIRKNLSLFFHKIVAGILMGLTMYVIYRTWNIFSYIIPERAENASFVGSTTFNLFLLTTITVFFSFLVYYLVCLYFKVEELKILKKYLNPIFKIGGVEIK